MNQVEDYLNKNQRHFVVDLCEYLGFPSVSADGHKNALNRCARWLLAHCRQIGLEAELCKTKGNPIVLARTPRRASKGKAHYLVYGHYDVQPAHLLDHWRTSPFKPRLIGHSLFARGASDNKGQHFAHLKAVEAYLKTGTELPCNVTFLIEGEEEIGSPSMSAFLRKNRARLRCDGVVISDTALYGLEHPALSYGLRGVCGFEIVLYGPSRDVHSGMFGGSIENPAMALCQLLSKLRDENGRITIPGFYKDVLELSPFERAAFESRPFDINEYKKSLGVSELFGEAGFTPIEQSSARPTLEINGLTSGYQGDGGKTIVPSWARAKLTMRLVPHQTPKQILAITVGHLKKLCPPTVRVKINVEHGGGEPYLLSPESAKIRTALDVLRSVFGHEPLLVREGGSIPVVNDFKRILGADSLLLGLALPDDNAHAPNEKLNLEVFAKGTLMSARLWGNLSRETKPGKEQSPS